MCDLRAFWLLPLVYRFRGRFEVRVRCMWMEMLDIFRRLPFWWVLAYWSLSFVWMAVVTCLLMGVGHTWMVGVDMLARVFEGRVGRFSIRSQ